MPSTFRWDAATHPCRPSGVEHRQGQWTNHHLGRPAGQARTGSLASGIRCTYEQGRGRVQAVQPRRVLTCLCKLALTAETAHADKARQSARIPDVSPVPSILAPRPRTAETGRTASAARTARPLERSLVDLGRGGVGHDINPPSGQLRSEACVLAFLANGQGELVVRHYYPGRARCLVRDSDRIHPGR